MKTLALVILVSACGLLSCLSKRSTESSEVKNSFVHDTTDVIVMPLDSIGFGIFDKNHKPTNLSIAELLILDSLLKTFIADYEGALSEDKVGHSKIDFLARKYKRQYVPAITSNGEKKVWVNCFCGNTYRNWRSQIISVDDGGSCFFNLIINLTRKSYSVFIVNGEA
jgi:hypothetical protein